jgi:signal peptide peptidase SppA
MNNIYALDITGKESLFTQAANGDNRAAEAMKAHFRGGSIQSKVLSADKAGENESKKDGVIALISISGAIDYKAGWLAQMFGAVDVLDVANTLRAAIADSSVSTIILDWDSPGGGIFGVPELSTLIYEARQSGTRIVSYLNPYSLSAGYWLASAAEEVYMLPSGYAGSVGAYVMHVDYSEALKLDGIKVTFIQAGEKKTDGNRFEPLSEQARVDIQKEVDEGYSLFVEHVARNRGVSQDEVRANFGKGASIGAKDALQNHMVDGILTLDDLIAMEVQRISESERRVSFFKQSKFFLQTRR